MATHRPKLAEEHHNFVPTPDKTCPNCGKTFNRMRDKSGRLEDRTVYQSRTYCSRPCAYEDRRRRTWEERRRDPDFGACEACDAEAVLQVHFIDGDPSNGAEENRQALCWRCHSFWFSTLKFTGRRAGRMPRLFDALDATPRHARNPKASTRPQGARITPRKGSDDANGPGQRKGEKTWG